jgi:hypothetical protein
MLIAKQVADLITLLRGGLAFVLIGLGLIQGAAGLPLAIITLLLAWTSDSLDGPIARRSRVQYTTWIGEHDLEMDILVSMGLLVYMLAASLVNLQLVVIYLLVWAVVFWRWGIARSLGMLIQAPIYGWFIWVSIRDVPHLGWWLIYWILAVVLITWPRFPKETVPGFLNGMHSLMKRD